MSGYLMMLVDGPAKGIEVHAAAPWPDRVAWAPVPGRETWTRVAPPWSDVPWPEQVTYRHAGTHGMTDSGDVILHYRVASA